MSTPPQQPMQSQSTQSPLPINTTTNAISQPNTVTISSPFAQTTNYGSSTTNIVTSTPSPISTTPPQNITTTTTPIASSTSAIPITATTTISPNTSSNIALPTTPTTPTTSSNPAAATTTITTTNSTTNAPTSNEVKSPQPKDKYDLAVLNYLKKKGYTNAEAILKQEIFNSSQSMSSPISPSDDEATSNQTNINTVTGNLESSDDQELAQYLHMYNSSNKGDTSNPQNYLEQYKKLGNWIHSSLDIYKNELLSILYPVFVHSYIDLITKGYPQQARELMEKIGPDHEEYFGDDLKLLRGISNTDHLKENELVDLFRNNRWNIKMCAYSFELLMSFLHQSNFILLLGLINQYIHINVSNLRPGFIDDEQYSISFQSEKDAGDLNSTPINYHSFKPDYEDEVLLQQKEKQQLEQGRILPLTDPNAPLPPVVAPPPPPPPTSGYIPKLKKKDKKKKEIKDERMLKIHSNVPIPNLTERFENELMEDFTKCVSLSSSHLPSICFYTIFNTYQGLNTTDISKDAQLVAGGFSDSSVKIWNLKEMKEQRLQQQQEQQQPQKPLNQNGYFENGNFASSASSASSAAGSLMNGSNNNSENNGNKSTTATNNKPQKIQKESEFKTFLGHSGPVYGCSFSPDSQYLLSCSEDTTARLWSMETMSNLVCYKGHNFPVWDVSFSPFGFYFATASHDRTARLWTTNHISPLRIFTGHLSDCNTVRFHPNINYLATGSNDKSARLWEVQTGKCVRIFMGHRAPIYTIAFSPDGRLLATAGEDTSVILWDLSTGKKVKKMDGHTKCVYSLDFSCDGSILASGSSDCTVRLWDVKKAFNSSLSTQPLINDESRKRKTLKSKLFSDELLETYPTKQTPVYNVCFSRRNLLLASGAFNTLTAFDKF
ncbi:hypothetical protein ACTFIV_009532 [Dictyostelium citrinum]